MVTLQQVQHGLSKYVSNELTSKMTGAQKWIFGAGAELYIGNIGSIFNKLKVHPMVSALGIIDEQDQIDIDKLYNVLLHQADNGPMTVDIPLAGAFTFNRSDVEKLYGYIVNRGGLM